MSIPSVSARIAALILAALATALVAGCGASSAPSNAPLGVTLTASPSAFPSASQTCHQVYETWRLHSGQLPIVQRISRDLNALANDANAEDFPKTQAAMVKIGKDANALSAYKMPACADPKGYYPKWLAALVAVGDNAHSGTSSFSGIVLALAPLKQVKKLTTNMAAELKTTAGE
jgi:hypothetical protein